MPVGTLASVTKTQIRAVEQLRGRYFGRYTGYVRDRNDPTKQGRVKIFIPGVMGAEDDTPSQWLDWCWPSSAGLAVPPYGAPVWVTFENGQVTEGIYSWAAYLTPARVVPLAGREEIDPTWTAEKTGSSISSHGGPVEITIPEDTARATKPVYPYNKVFESEGGIVLELDDSPDLKRVRVYHPTGTTILIDSDGSVQIHSEGATHFHSKGDFNILLGQGATFKVAYPGSGGISVGSNGVRIAGPQVNLMGRTVRRSGDPLG